MRYILAFCICLFFSCQALGQTTLNKNTELYVNSVPLRLETNLSRLVDYLTKPYGNDYEKARAIAYYIASHISYDEYLFHDGKKTRLNVQSKSLDEILKQKAGVCADFTKLFVAMCQKAGIKAFPVSGYVLEKKQRKTKDTAHAWSYFWYRNRKVYVDPTFMAGGRTGYNSYITDLNHQQALRKRERANKYNSVIYPINAYYFDFNYKNEKKDFGRKRIEK